MLLQEHDERDLKPVGYWSRSLNDAERRYDTTQEAFVGVVSAVFLLRPYTEGSQFILRTNHQALRLILDLKRFTTQVACWRLHIMAVDFENQSRPARMNMVADVFYCLRSEMMDRTDPVEDLLDQYDAYVRVFIIEAKETYNDRPHLEKLTISELLSEQKREPLCKELSKLVAASS